MSDTMTPEAAPAIPVKKRPPGYSGVGAAKRTRSSVDSSSPANSPTAFQQVRNLLNGYQPLGYMLPWETLDYVELLSTYNPDYSQAVENIKMLANSGHELHVDAGSALATRRLKARLEEKARTIQAQHGGIDGIIDKLMDQAATYGAMCFRGDTEVITSDGVRQINSLVGQVVKVRTRGGGWVPAPISSFGVQNLWKITLRRGRGEKVIWATPNHRWIVRSAEGEDGAYRVRPPKGISRTLGEWQADRLTLDLTEGDSLVTVLPSQQAGNLARIPISPFGIAQGIVFGDGTAPRSARGVKPSASLDLYGDKVSDLMKFFPLSNTTTCKLDGIRVLDLPRTWKDLPSKYECSSHLLGWLAGYFAVDGHVTASGGAVLTSANKGHLKFAEDVLVRVGGVSDGIFQKSSRGGGEVAEGEYEQFVLRFPSACLPENFYVRPHHREARKEAKRRDWKVVSVEQTDLHEEVFCATVPNTSCFVLAGNILTGNCGEWILSDDLDDVVDFADLNPKNIRYFWEESEQRNCPYQKVTAGQAKEAKAAGQKVIGNHVKLNETTFHYYAFDAAPESPYGTPPFLAALTNIAIQRDIIANMAQIVKKIGLLGLVDLSIEALDPLPGETDEAYVLRARAYLDEYTQAAEDMMRDGGLVHFNDVSVTTSQLGGNAAGATNIHKANEEMVFSGLKSMPSVQGRSYSTTETYAGVAYDIIIRNTRKYQRAAKRMIESGYWAMAVMWGEQPNSIKLAFNENRSINRMQDASAQKVEIQNALMLWIMGILDQQGVAMRLGESNVAQEMTEPPEALIGNLTAHGVDDPNNDPGLDFPTPRSTDDKMEEPEDG